MTKVGTMYINGEKVKSQDFNLWPAGDFKQFVTGMKYSGMEPTEYPIFTFGFAKSRQGTQWQDTDFGNYDSPASNHFKGLLDDVIIYHKVLTAEEISLMYNSGK